MSNEYYQDCFDPAHIVQEDMQKIETNFEALRTVFSSTSGPAVTVPYQLWGDTSPGDSMLKIRNITNTAWLNIFDVEHDEIQISDSVRKASIVEGEAISPATCTIQGGGTVAFVSNFPCDYIGSETYSTPLPQTIFAVPGFGKMKTQVYVYDGQQVRGKLHCSISVSRDVEVRLVIGAQTSAGSGYFSPGSGGAWSPQVSLSVAGTGWQNLQWEVKSDSIIGGSITSQGHCINQV